MVIPEAHRRIDRRASLPTLDKWFVDNYSRTMNVVRRTLEIDAETDARLTAMAAERGEDVTASIAEAVALLDSVFDLSGPDLAEDRRRLDEFARTRQGVGLNSVKACMSSCDTVEELPRPLPHKIG